ncbi:MAG TPA: hypothetical protein VGO92_12250 [Acidimicrobiales bacterium]|nr:hypothetical protein [Acidimicrobiales bacterium]
MRRTLAVVLFAVVVPATTAKAPPAAAEPGHMASYHGRQIDLSKDWEGAQACAIVSDDDIRCFDSQEELETELQFGQGEAPGKPEKGGAPSASVATASTAAAAGLTTYCLGYSDLWLTLYEHSSFGGRSLNFRDESLWQNLTLWTFNDMMSSWKNNTYCDAYASWDINGGGAWLTMTARSQNTYVGATWNDQASAIYIT